jgi:putative hydrolases of HD superfamily
MDTAELEGVLAFMRAAEGLKTATRSGWTSTGRPESVADHTWRLCLLALALRPGLPEVDYARLLPMLVIHDLGEAIGGDIPAPEQAAHGGAKATDERRDLLRLTEPLPEAQRAEIAALWDEYEAAQTPEARVAKALDKLETILQHNQGRNPADFDYRFNLAYGQQYTGATPLLAALRAMLDAETEQRARDSGGGADSPAPSTPGG